MSSLVMLKTTEVIAVLFYAGESLDEKDNGAVKNQPEETIDAGVTAVMTTPHLLSETKGKV